MKYTEGLPKFIGKSPEAIRIRKAISAFARKNENILILGETGSGRALAAQSIFATGFLKEFPLVPVSCAAIGETEDPDILFSLSPQKGSLYALKKGTVLFSNINDTKEEYQIKILNFFRSCRTGTIRIISTAESVLDNIVMEHRFRPDLYLEISTFRLAIPPLRERKQDIPFLFSYFLDKFCHEFNKPVPPINLIISEAIREYEWPGNIGELMNCVRNLVMLSPENQLAPEYLPFRVHTSPLDFLTHMDLASAVAEVEKYLIRRALARHDGNQSKAAGVLKISEAALRYKMKKYGFTTAR
ncbi:sigma-54-dependent Fis family transcriptional regulator [candidate division KSB1 bacterium]|nr:sigma-54-dependent Fis family transcriptional regulator [candidate division KSB1 bacterium]